MINHKLRGAREQRHWSIERSARETGLSKTSIIRWENGEQEPRGTSLEILCTIYGKSADDLGYSGSAPADGIVLLTAEEARDLVLLLGLGDTDMHHFDEMKRKTIQRLIAAAGTAVVTPQLFINSSEPWERLRTGRPTDIDTATLDHFEGLIKSCWGLSNSSQLDIAEQVLSNFLPRLVHLAPHNLGVAGLASEGLHLQSILAAHRLKISDKVTLCQRAVELAEHSKDYDRIASCLTELAVAYRYAQKPEEALWTYQQALCYAERVSPLIRTRVYAGTSVALSRLGRNREAEFYLDLGYTAFPEHPEHDPSFRFYPDGGRFTLALYDGLTRLNMGQAGEAWKIFDYYLQDPANKTASKRIRLEITNHQGHAAILSGDLGKYVVCLEDGLAGAIALKSKKRFDEAYSIFQQDIPAAWLRETPIKQIVERYGLRTLNK